MLYTASDAFIKDIGALKGNSSVINRLENFIELIETAKDLSDLPNTKKLKGLKNAYLYRIGAYRIGFYLEENEIFLSRIQHRSKIYNIFP